MHSNSSRAVILVAAAAAFGVPLAACAAEPPAKAPNLGSFEVPSGASAKPAGSGSALEASCGGGPEHGCGAVKPEPPK